MALWVATPSGYRRRAIGGLVLSVLGYPFKWAKTRGGGWAETEYSSYRPGMLALHVAKRQGVVGEGRGQGDAAGPGLDRGLPGEIRRSLVLPRGG